MSYASLKSLLIAALVAGASMTAPALAAAPAAADKAVLDKTAIEKIVEDYIIAHPETILKSVDDYQQKTMADHQTRAVKANATALYEDDSAPFIGNPKADVVLVEFFDYNCGYCKKAFNEIKGLADGDKNLKIVFKDFPILGQTSETAAKWALAAQKQKKYIEFHTAMMNNRQQITDALLEKVAKDAGLDVAKAKVDAEGTEILIQIEKNRTLATQMGISGTPAFVIGQEIMAGVATADQLKAKIADVRKAKK